MTSSISRRRFLGAAAALPVAGLAHGQDKYPARDLSWLIYQSPGGSVDLQSRLIQPFLERQGFRTTLDYATGAGGRIARTKLYNARPDGYTIMTQVAPGAVIDSLLFNVPYRVENFEPIFGWSRIGFQYCVKADSPMRTFADFVAETKKRRVTVGSIGRGSALHLHMVVMRRELGLNFDIVHFDGSSPAYAAVLGGHVDSAIGGAGSGSRQGSKLHFLTVTGPGRDRALPNVPTLAEQGFKVSAVEQLFFAETSPKVPADRVKALSIAFEKAFAEPELKQRFEAAGEFITKSTPDELRAVHKQQSALVAAFKEELQK